MGDNSMPVFMGESYTKWFILFCLLFGAAMVTSWVGDKL